MAVAPRPDAGSPACVPLARGRSERLSAGWWTRTMPGHPPTSGTSGRSRAPFYWRMLTETGGAAQYSPFEPSMTATS